jgi:hypothetical protein
MEEDFGVMDEAYHISRTELVLWFNTKLDLKLHCIEQLGTGAPHVQIIDLFFPGSVNMSRVSWKAKTSWEFVANFKVLQQGFDVLGLKKKIDVEKLTQAKYQDNLEFAQWIKRFCDLNGSEPEQPYDGPAKRNNQDLFYKHNLQKYKSLMSMAERAKNKKDNSNVKMIGREGGTGKRSSHLKRKKGTDKPPTPVARKNSNKTTPKTLAKKKTIPEKKVKKEKVPSKEKLDIEFVISILKSESTDEEKIELLKERFGIQIKVESEVEESEEIEEAEDSDDNEEN